MRRDKKRPTIFRRSLIFLCRLCSVSLYLSLPEKPRPISESVKCQHQSSNYQYCSRDGLYLLAMLLEPLKDALDICEEERGYNVGDSQPHRKYKEIKDSLHNGFSVPRQHQRRA